METGKGLGMGGAGGYVGLGGDGKDWAGAHLAKSSVCLIGSKPKHAVYLHISIQYIKYRLFFFFF